MQQRPFERKYSLSFYKFKKKVESSPSEDFEQWDDLIEREAYTRAYEEWKEKICGVTQSASQAPFFLPKSYLTLRI